MPFLKVDKGLSDEKDGVHLMKRMPELAALLNKAVAKRIFGTKMRSVINQANGAGNKAGKPSFLYFTFLTSILLPSRFLASLSLESRTRTLAVRFSR